MFLILFFLKKYSLQSNTLSFLSCFILIQFVCSERNYRLNGITSLPTRNKSVQYGFSSSTDLCFIYCVDCLLFCVCVMSTGVSSAARLSSSVHQEIETSLHPARQIPWLYVNVLCSIACLNWWWYYYCYYYYYCCCVTNYCFFIIVCFYFCEFFFLNR